MVMSSSCITSDSRDPTGLGRGSATTPLSTLFHHRPSTYERAPDSIASNVATLGSAIKRSWPWHRSFDGGSSSNDNTRRVIRRRYLLDHARDLSRQPFDLVLVVRPHRVVDHHLGSCTSKSIKRLVVSSRLRCERRYRRMCMRAPTLIAANLYAESSGHERP